MNRQTNKQNTPEISYLSLALYFMVQFTQQNIRKMHNYFKYTNGVWGVCVG